MQLTILAKAAPLMPNLGISITFKTIFIVVATNIMFWKIFWFPVIWSMYPTDPDIALTNCPKVRIVKAVAPALNSLPKILSICDGKRRKLRSIGKEDQKISFVDC